MCKVKADFWQINRSLWLLENVFSMHGNIYIHICLEGDSLTTVNKINDGQLDLSHCGTILQGIFTYAAWLLNFDCRHTPRACN